MKYSNLIGIIAAGLLIAACFIPWVYISSINTTLTGVYTGKTSLGKPGAINIIMAVVSVILFIVPTILAKRANIFAGALNMAWSVRNYLLVTQCQMGECPEKRFGIYAILLLSVILLLMTMFPNIELKDEPTPP